MSDHGRAHPNSHTPGLVRLISCCTPPPLSEPIEGRHYRCRSRSATSSYSSTGGKQLHEGIPSQAIARCRCFTYAIALGGGVINDKQFAILQRETRSRRPISRDSSVPSHATAVGSAWRHYKIYRQGIRRTPQTLFVCLVVGVEEAR